jgi:hypothetical protein
MKERERTMTLEIKSARCPAGGFSRDLPAVYFLVVGNKIYIGKTGTSSHTGISSPYQRLATHLRKHGNTQSALWDLFASDQDLNEVEIIFSFAYVPRRIRSQRIEQGVVFDARERFGEDVVLNRSPAGGRPGMTDDEERLVQELVIEISAALTPDRMDDTGAVAS